MWNHDRLGGMLQSVLDGDQGRQYSSTVRTHGEDEPESVPLQERIQFGCVMVGVQQGNCPPHESSSDVALRGPTPSPADLRCFCCPTSPSLSDPMLGRLRRRESRAYRASRRLSLEPDRPDRKKRRRKG